MVDDVLRMRATIETSESLAKLREWGREIGYLPNKVKPGIKSINTEFAALSKTIQSVGKEITSIVPALGGFGLGAAGAGIAAGALISTLGAMAKRIVELREVSKELGMGERDIRAWGLAAEKVGISSGAMQQSLLAFKKTTDGLRYNIGGVRDDLYSIGAGPVVQRIQAATKEADKLEIAFGFIEQLWKDDPSGFKAHMFAQQIGLGWDAAKLSLEGFLREQRKLPQISKEAQEAAKKYADSLIDLGAAWDHLALKAAAPLFPVLTTDIEDLEKIVALFDKIGEWLKKWTGATPTLGSLTNKMMPEWLQGGKWLPESMRPKGGEEPPPGDTTRQQGMQELQRKLREMAPQYQRQSYVPGDTASTDAGRGPGAPPVGPGGSAGITAPAGTPIQHQGMATVTSASGKQFQVDARVAENFQGFISDYEKAGGVLGPNTGTLGTRPNPSGHPIGEAIDINQVSRNARAGGVTLPLEQENTLAAKWGLVSGAQWHRPDAGHFGVRNFEAARQALIRNGVEPGQASAMAGSPEGGTTVKGSVFGTGFGFVDRSEPAGRRTASGVPNTVPGIALPSREGLGKMFSVTTPDGRKFMLPQTDLGPAGYTGRGIDISAAAAKGMGYTRKNFPTDQPFNYRRIDELTGVPQKAEGNVNVSIQSNGTAAKANAKTDGGLWQKTTIQNYRQMQPTNAPVGTVGAFNE